MRFTLVVSCIALSAALCACSKKPAAPAASGAAPSSAAASAAPVMAPPAAVGPETRLTEAQLPAPKAGLWERTSLQDSEPPRTDKKCLDGKPINPTAEGPHCTKVDIVRNAAGAVVIDATCPSNGINGQMHMAIAGDMNTAYTTDSEVALSEPGKPPLVLKNHSSYRYLGVCPAGK